MKQRVERINASDGLELNWQAWEPDLSPRATICLVHGLGEHADRYHHVAKAFVADDMAFHAIDLRGHGKSGGKRGHTPSREQWFDDVQSLLDRAHANTPRFLYGHSLGGMLVISYVMHRSPTLNGVIATGPALRRGFEVPAIKIVLGKLMSNVWPTFSQHSNLNPHDISRDPAIVQAYIDDPLVHDWASARLFTVATTAGEEALWNGAKFDLPLMLICGQEDQLIDVSACEQFFTAVAGDDKTLRILPGVHHEVHNEPEKADVIDEMLRWVRARI